ncbi:MAG: alkaline phosphatase family protein [Kovacikia sp.]
MFAHPPGKTIILAFCSFGLSFMAQGCFSSPQVTGAASPKASSSIANTRFTNSPSVPTPADKAIPRYDHIFVLIEENKGYDQIIGNTDAPNINQLAHTYGLASNFYGEVHPSEANYIALLGGSTFGIHDDDAYYCQPNDSDQFCSNSEQPDYVSHTVTAKSLLDQLQEKGLTWKGYFESIPAPGSKVVVAPGKIRALYAVKHNGFLNFKNVQDDPDLPKKIVGLDQLASDLKGGKVPNYSHIVLNQCHEMHGLPECSNLKTIN